LRSAEQIVPGQPGQQAAQVRDPDNIPLELDRRR